MVHSQARPQAPGPRTHGMGHHLRPHVHPRTVRVVQHRRVLGPVRQHIGHPRGGGQRRQGRGQLSAGQDESGRPDRGHPQEEPPARMAIHVESRSHGVRRIGALLRRHCDPRRLQRSDGQRAHQFRHTPAARLLRQREGERRGPQDHRRRRHNCGPPGQQHLRLHRQQRDQRHRQHNQHVDQQSGRQLRAAGARADHQNQRQPGQDAHHDRRPAHHAVQHQNQDRRSQKQRSTASPLPPTPPAPDWLPPPACSRKHNPGSTASPQAPPTSSTKAATCSCRRAARPQPTPHASRTASSPPTAPPAPRSTA